MPGWNLETELLSLWREHPDLLKAAELLLHNYIRLLTLPRSNQKVQLINQGFQLGFIPPLTRICAAPPLVGILYIEYPDSQLD